MQDAIVRRMHLVFGAGLELKERLDRDEAPSFQAEYNKLYGLLLAGGELDTDRTYRGDFATAAHQSLNPNFGERFAGVQYALACWLDETFVTAAPEWWAGQWIADTLEVRLYGGTQERRYRFWEQARRAQDPKGSPEAVEAFLWAAMLGFRGKPEEAHPPVDPAAWVENARRRVLSARSAEFPTPAHKDPPTYVPPLRGPDWVRTMLRVAAVVGSGAVFAVTLALVYWFNR